MTTVAKHPDIEPLSAFTGASGAADEYFMGLALEEARAAADEGEIPIGAVIVAGGRVIGRGHNLTESLHDVTAHAEMLAISAAANHLGAKFLTDATMYVTVEPCPMCAGAIGWSRIGRLVIGAPEPKRGYRTIAHKAGGDAADASAVFFHPRTAVVEGVRADECAALMRSFFSKKR